MCYLEQRPSTRLFGQYEPHRDKTNKIAYAPSEDSDQTGQSDQSLRCPLEESLGPWLPSKRTAKTLGIRPVCSESSLGAHAMVLVLSRCSSYGEKFPLWTIHQVRLTLRLAIYKICFRISNHRVLGLLIQSKGAMFHYPMFYDKFSVSHRLYCVCSINGHLHTVFAVYCTS